MKLAGSVPTNVDCLIMLLYIGRVEEEEEGGGGEREREREGEREERERGGGGGGKEEREREGGKLGISCSQIVLALSGY